MPRHVVFLRGVSPMNARMSELVRCFETAGLTNVRTVLGSGNVVLDSTARSESAVETQAEKAMRETLGRTFFPIVRSQKYLQLMIDDDPFAGHRVPARAKRVVSFLRKRAHVDLALPLSVDGATVFGTRNRELFTAYVVSPKGPVFMRLIEKAAGKEVTTRTWDTVRKCARA